MLFFEDITRAVRTGDWMSLVLLAALVVGMAILLVVMIAGA